MPVRVLIVDPQPFFCEVLADALPTSELDVVGWTTEEREANRLAASCAPDVVLTELGLSSGSGLSLARRLRDRTRVVLLTREPEGDVLLEAVAAGAVGCLSHDTQVGALRPMVVGAATGRFALDPDRLLETLKRASAARRRDGGLSTIARLTLREREILKLLANGLDDGAIGAQLHLSARTVRTHVRNILRKLDVHSRADAALIALASGESRTGTHLLRIEGPAWSHRDL